MTGTPIALLLGVDTRLAAFQQAGITTYIAGLLRGLVSVLGDDERIVLLRSRKDRDLGWLEQTDLGERLSSRFLVTPPHHRWEQLGLAVELARRRLDLLHFPDFIPAFHRPCPAVITVHDLAFLRFPGMLTPESARYYGQIARAVHSAEAIIAVSECTRRDLIDLVGVSLDKIHVISEAAGDEYRPMGTAAVRQLLAERYGLEQGYLLFVGTVEPRKNLPWLLETYANLRSSRRPQCGLPPLVVVGRRGWLCQPSYETVDRLGLSSVVRFVDGVGRSELPLLYNGASVLVFPSLYEGFGLPLLEAMACGTPVIASDVSSIPEVVGDAGLLVPLGDHDALGEAIVRVLMDTELAAELRRKGLTRAMQFSWRQTALQTLDVYHNVVGRGNA